MTRINTNVSALVAEQNLNNSNNQLQTTLTRLSTGLQINSAADNPAGMIAATDLGANISASNQAISNSQVASQMISTADSALSQISSLLTTINGLITESANTSSESSSQITANQSQIDSSLSAINSIANTTNFQGQNLLDGSLAFTTTAGTNYGAVQDLQVNQANFGTSSSVPVSIDVTALAQQAQIGSTVNDGVSSDTQANTTLAFTDGSTLKITAPSTGASANGMLVAFQESSTIAAGAAKASFDASTNTLNITVSNTGLTSDQTIADAINNETPFTAKASTTLATKGYLAGTDTRTNASTTITTDDGGKLKITSLDAASDADTVKFTTSSSVTAANPTVTTSAGTLTVTVSSNGQTSLASIASAINTYAEGNSVSLSASVTKAGTFDTAVDESTGVAPDGVGTAAAASGTSVTVAGATGGFIYLDAAGALGNSAQVVVNQVASTQTSSAQWNASGNGGKGVLTLNLSTGKTYDGTDITNLLAAAETPAGAAVTTPFSVSTSQTTSFSVTSTASTDDLSTSPITTTDTGSGSNGIALAIPTAGQTLVGGSGTGGGELLGGTGSAGLTANVVLQVNGNAGGQLFTFDEGTTAAEMATALNQASNSTGVQASAIGDQLLFNSTNYGSAANVAVKVVNEGTGGTFGSSLTATNESGKDIAATVNGVAATGQGNTVSLNSPTLAFSAALDPTQLTVGENVGFNVTGGGALFQLGPTVTSAQQFNLGIQSVDTSALGGTVGRLYEIGSGNNAALTTNASLAGQIVQSALNSVTSLRGQLGAFQTATIDSNISTLTNAVTNLTAAQSDIQDADFASESANLTREQILVQSGTTVMGIANSNPANVLTLLQKASQV